MTRVFSGIQPTGQKHLGNYIGAIRHWPAYQDLGEAIYCVVDLHSISVPYDAPSLRENTLDTAATLLAAGLDPDRCTLFAQSSVPEHSEGAWLLGALATFGELNRMTQFKEKSEGQESVSVDLFTYPVLQAADILLYHTDKVPVGDDQRQHLELARDIAQRFNSRYGEFLTLPEAAIPGTGGRVMDLQDPTRKMSTTRGTPQGTLLLTDSDRRRHAEDPLGRHRLGPRGAPGGRRQGGDRQPDRDHGDRDRPLGRRDRAVLRRRRLRAVQDPTSPRPSRR